MWKILLIQKQAQICEKTWQNKYSKHCKKNKKKKKNPKFLKLLVVHSASFLFTAANPLLRYTEEQMNYRQLALRKHGAVGGLANGNNMT